MPRNVETGEIIFIGFYKMDLIDIQKERELLGKH